MIPKKILFCTDFSENSLPARSHATDYARVLGAELLIIHVIDSSQLGYSSLAEGVPLDIRSTLENIQLSANRALEIMATDCRRDVSDVSVFSCMGSPAYEIARFTQENGVSLIVMGTHGWTGIKHLIMGSTADKVLRSAMCPVLTVRSASETE
jgi:universal stress protein A